MLDEAWGPCRVGGKSLCGTFLLAARSALSSGFLAGATARYIEVDRHAPITRLAQLVAAALAAAMPTGLDGCHDICKRVARPGHQVGEEKTSIPVSTKTMVIVE